MSQEKEFIEIVVLLDEYGEDIVLHGVDYPIALPTDIVIAALQAAKEEVQIQIGNREN